MVDREIPGGSTVLAAVTVAGQNRVPRQAKLGHRSTHMVVHLHDRGNVHLSFARTHRGLRTLQDLCFTKQDQADCASQVADVQGLVVRIEKKNIMCGHGTDSPRRHETEVTPQNKRGLGASAHRPLKGIAQRAYRGRCPLGHLRPQTIGWSRRPHTSCYIRRTRRKKGSRVGIFRSMLGIRILTHGFSTSGRKLRRGWLSRVPVQ